MKMVGAHGIVNSVDPDKTAPGAEQSNLGLHIFVKAF